MHPEDYNYLDKWLREKLRERGLSVEDLAVRAKISRRVLYMWLDDSARPKTQSVAKAVHALSAVPLVAAKDGCESSTESVALEEMLRQFVERRTGRPKKT